MKPLIPITNRAFKYTNAANTDIAATFRRIRRERAEQAKADQAEQATKVAPIRRAKT